MPVGRITYFHLEPLSFEEFLKAKKFDKMVEFLHSYKINNPMPEAIHDKCMQLFKEYTLIGGMPAIVNSWVNKQSLSEISALQHDLLTTFRDDFTKYAKRIAPDFLDEIFNAIPTMLGGKFVYSHVNKELSQIKLKAALNLLCKARVCHKVKCAAGNGIPLAAEVNEKLFKVLMLDTGLASAKLGLNLAQLEQISDLNLIHQGGLSEQVVGQLLRTTELQYIEPSLYYWTRSAKNANAELDYLIQHGPTVIPIEVKSGKTGSLKSLHLFMHLKKLQRAVRINADLPSVVTVNSLLHDKSTVSYELLSLPFYLVEQLPRLL
jgi:predicted AAA+ superfamily ATPase